MHKRNAHKAKKCKVRCKAALMEGWKLLDQPQLVDWLIFAVVFVLGCETCTVLVAGYLLAGVCAWDGNHLHHLATRQHLHNNSVSTCCCWSASESICPEYWSVSEEYFRIEFSCSI
jgi:hypothetical protein